MAHSREDKEGISKKELQQLMQVAYIPGISITSISSSGQIHTEALGVLDNDSKSEKKDVNIDTQFWACSLSKPVFAYLIIKLMEEGILPENFMEKEISFHDKKFTPQMILSHQTGLPNGGPPDEKFYESIPGKVFRYSGEGYLLLQKMIKEHTGKELEELAKAYVFDILGMTRSSFLFPTNDKNLAKNHNEAMEVMPLSSMDRSNSDNAAGSLHTTSHDYARFLMECLNNQKFLDLIRTPLIGAMKKDIDLTTNKESKELKVDSETLKRIDWGLGFGLQKDKDGRVTHAFHWGDGPGLRTFFAMNVNSSKSAVVYLTNSENGLAIAENIANLTVGDIAPAMSFLGQKYGYKKITYPGWKEYHDHLMMGVAAEKKRDYVEAIKFYKQAAEINPDNTEIQYNILWAEINNATPITPGIEKLNKITGQYGPVKIITDNSILHIQEGGQARQLTVIDENTFLDGVIILKFNANSIPPALTFHFPNGAQPVFTCTPIKEAALSTTAHTTRALGISPILLSATHLDDEKAEAESVNTISVESDSPTVEVMDNDLTDAEMVKSTFGNSSDTAKKFRRTH
jgi:CubicO group peptidase (beta-lactamase class C family)